MTRHIGISVPHRKVEDDDDIQEYKRPWVGLTDEDIKELDLSNYVQVVRIVEAKLKEKNT
jgi:hypothetical protein